MKGRTQVFYSIPMSIAFALAFAGEAEGRSGPWIRSQTSASRLSTEERCNLLGARLPDDYETLLCEAQKRHPAYRPFDLPSRFDWTDSLAVGPVRQQLCGDCWAQASVGAMECALRIYDGDTTQLSVQQVVDCNYGSSACHGGWTDDTYNLFRVVGAVTEACYPYIGADGNCGLDSCEIVAALDTWEYIDTTVVSLKTHLMAGGPIAVGMTVYSDFYSYGGGCYEHGDTFAVNHAVLLVGWDDSMCDGHGAWHIKNSWGDDWGEAGYAWLRYGTCRIGEGASIVYYTPQGSTRLRYASFVIDDSAGDGDGRADPGETVTLRLSIANQGWEAATGVSVTIMTAAPEVEVLTASATFPDIAPAETAESNPHHFAFAVDSAALCGARAEFMISADCDQVLSTDAFDLLVGDAETIFADDAEEDLGWSREAPDDDATAGRWRRRNPTGSFIDSMLVQPETDHTPGQAKMCFFTNNTLRRLHPDVADVDGGKNTVTSPDLDLSGYASVRVRYLRWYSNDTGEAVDDTWKVDASGDSGQTWVNLETDGESERAWIPIEFNLGDYVDLSEDVLLRFVVSDYGEESTVEAAVDDIEITGCPYAVDVSPPSVTVVSPKGGEEIVEGSEAVVRWEADDDYGIREIMAYASYDGGVTYPDTIGVAGPLDSALTWQVPLGERPACRLGIEVLDRGYNTSFDESDSTFAIVRDPAGVPEHAPGSVLEEVELFGSIRNPITASTHVFFSVPHKTHVRLCVYNARGRLIRELKKGTVEEGFHSVMWDGRSVSGGIAASGIYFIHLEAGRITRTAKITLTR